MSEKLDKLRIPAFYPGTGDTFSSVLVGAFLQGDSLPVANHLRKQEATHQPKRNRQQHRKRNEDCLLYTSTIPHNKIIGNTHGHIMYIRNWRVLFLSLIHIFDDLSDFKCTL